MKKDEKEEKISFKESLNNLKLAFGYALKHKKSYIIYVVLTFFLSILSVISPFLSAKQLTALNTGLLTQLVVITIIIFVITIVDGIIKLFSGRKKDIFLLELKKSLQLDVAKSFLNMEIADLQRESSGVFINRLSHDVSNVTYVFFSLNDEFSGLITDIGVLISIFLINKTLFLYLFIGMIITFLLKENRSRKIYKMDKKHRKTIDSVSGFVNEIVRGVLDIKVLNAEDAFLKKLDNTISYENDEWMDMSYSDSKLYAFTDVISSLIELGFILIGVYLIKNNYISVANFVVVYMYKGYALNFLSTFNRIIDVYRDFALSSSRVFRLFGSDEFRQDKFGKRKIKKVKGNFEFKNVSFSYDNKKDVLKNISFKIEHDKTIAFVGKSGSGKTTIFNLITKLYSPTSGKVYMDGIDISKLNKDSIRGNISIITQNPYIFNMSIKENFSIIKKDVTDNEIINACKTAMLHDFIMELPDGYDTIVGEGGVKLSGGQRQRLAIARALVQNTKVILFDEATSALDNETQNAIQSALNNMKNKYTILIIAHRFSTVINSDNIMMIDDGKIIAQGTHDELIKSSKEYKKLYELEFKHK